MQQVELEIVRTLDTLSRLNEVVLTGDESTDEWFDNINKLVERFSTLKDMDVPEVQVPLDLIEFVDRNEHPDNFLTVLNNAAVAADNSAKGKELATEKFHNFLETKLSSAKLL
eukprot:TRINITY_DN14826_c0_g1_i1.p1 TRINITY_DN14826_c0_g1~~TRINITY_DN14826_c0_g1_i1.p1  ORF type:complete len:124 (-),score=37.82 TRINITY_DN14826_c0_g1_i1:1-339(-)